MKHISNFLLIALITSSSLLSAQSTRDTLYPGVDLQILSLESLKKEVIQGEGIAVQMSIKNAGITTSVPTRIDFWISDNDEAMLTQDDVNSSKELLPLKQDSKVDFSHLIVIPEEYKGKFVYITAALDPNPKNGTDPTPDNNNKFMGVKIGDPASYKDGMYTYDGAIKSFELVKAPKKITRTKPVKSKIIFTINGTKAPKPGQTIDIILSKDKVLDAGDAEVMNFPVPPSRNGEDTEIIKEITFGKHYAKGKSYIFAVMRSGKWNDPNSDNNAAGPVKIKLK
jgi:hypothetical protein